MFRYLTKQVQQIKSEFGGQVNGAYFMNPGIKGFAQDHFTDAFDTARQSKLKVGMQLAGVQFDANTVASTDLSVVFIGHFNEMTAKEGEEIEGRRSVTDKKKISTRTTFQARIPMEVESYLHFFRFASLSFCIA